MRRQRRGRAALLACLGALAALVGPAAARGETFSLALTGPPTGVVGRPLALQASGVNPPPAEYWFVSYLDVYAIPASVVPACPAGYLDGLQAASQTASAGGERVAGPLFEHPDPAGAWSTPIAYTPKAAGRILLCAYTENVTNTLAAAAWAIEVRPAPTARKAKRKKCRKQGRSPKHRCAKKGRGRGR